MMGKVLLKCFSRVGLAVVLAASTAFPVMGNASAYADEPILPEAQLAEEERAADIADLGYIPGEVLVVYEEGTAEDEKDAAAEAVGGECDSREASFDDLTVGKVLISDDMTVEVAVEALEAEPAVKYAVPNYLAELFDTAEVAAYSTASSTLDTAMTQQWYLDYVNAPEAWALLSEKGIGQKVKVGVVDTGASLSHADLKNVVSSESVEVLRSESSGSVTWRSAALRGDGYTNGSTSVTDFSSHGTHVSGIIAAEAGNGGIAGVASGGATAVANSVANLIVADAFPLMVETSSGLATTAEAEDIIYALEYLSGRGCEVINMSLGFTAGDASLTALFNDIIDRLVVGQDIVVVVAMGNNGGNVRCIPAICNNAIAVGSLTANGWESSAGWQSIESAQWMTGNVTRSAFSNYGSWCDLAAPGERIYSTYLRSGATNTYAFLDGTSMASPVVAAVAAMVRAANPSLTATQVADVLYATADDLCTSGVDAETGHGAVDAEAAVAEAYQRAAAATTPTRPDAPTASEKEPAVAPAKPTTPVAGGKEPQTATRNGWYRAAGTWYYYRNGKALTGWQSIGGSWYYFKSSGAMVAGWQKIGGSWYYLKSSGAMATGWQKVDGSWYYLKSSGAMATGWQKVSGSWYYLKPSGAMATGWQKIGGAWYYLKSSGAMATGWYKVGAPWYYSSSSGAMQSNRWVGNYYVTSSGAMATNSWIGRYHVNASGLWDATR